MRIVEGQWKDSRRTLARTLGRTVGRTLGRTVGRTVDECPSASVLDDVTDEYRFRALDRKNEASRCSAC